MNKTYHFCAGLPRSGSTLLMNILAQNPRFHCTATSGVLDIVLGVRNRFWENSALRAMSEEEIDIKVRDTMRGTLDGFYSNISNPVVFDKSRGWESYLETVAEILGRRPKVLCPVRDVRDVLASLEKLTRKTSATRQHPDEKAFPWRHKTIEGRCELWLANEGGLVGVPINCMRDAVQRGWRDCLYFVEYERLTKTPAVVIKEIYEFLGEEQYQHNFENVEQVTYENDLIHVFKDLHKIRQKVEPQGPQWPSVLPRQLGEAYGPQAQFWKTL